MSEATGRPVSPRICDHGGRPRLSYTGLGGPRIAHGIIVFKQLELGSEYSRWLDLASSELLSSLVPAPERIAIPHQIHSSHIIDIDTIGTGLSVGDGVVTSRPLTVVGVSVSDCIPLFAVSVDDGVVGIAHCGWKGIAGGIVEQFLQVLRSKSAGPERTEFLIGAAIGPCCYEVGDDLLERFMPDEVRDYSRRMDRGIFFDLRSVVASRLAAGGARPDKISIDKTCTSCQKYLLSSYRADGRDCGRMLAFLMLTE